MTPSSDTSRFAAGDRFPLEEMIPRHERCRAMLASLLPQAGGLLIGGPTNIYYLTGTMAEGIFWLPLEGVPVLAVRKAPERARLESPLTHIRQYRSFRELEGIMRDARSPLTDTVGVDTRAVSWEAGRLMEERLPCRLVGADAVISRCRALKSPLEIDLLREAGRRHALVLEEDLPALIKPGMSELDIARQLWTSLLQRGHHGPSPSGMAGIGVFLGYVSVGDNGNYPNAYDGPLGIKGVHPAAPTMGHAHSVWQDGQVCSVDIGFNLGGYITDKTQVFFSGKTMPDEIRRAQEAAETIERECAAMLRPGAEPAAIYARSLELAASFGFSDAFMGEGGNKVRFIGHGIGLTISEWPILAKGFTDPIQENMVIALEPKIALPGIAMVGSENTYLVTAHGAERLTGSIGSICVE